MAAEKRDCFIEDAIKLEKSLYWLVVSAVRFGVISFFFANRLS